MSNLFRLIKFFCASIKKFRDVGCYILDRSELALIAYDVIILFTKAHRMWITSMRCRDWHSVVTNHINVIRHVVCKEKNPKTKFITWVFLSKTNNSWFKKQSSLEVYLFLFQNSLIISYILLTTDSKFMKISFFSFIRAENKYITKSWFSYRALKKNALFFNLGVPLMTRKSHVPLWLAFYESFLFCWSCLNFGVAPFHIYVVLFFFWKFSSCVYSSSKIRKFLDC